jgi:hypothetical protein
MFLQSALFLQPVEASQGGAGTERGEGIERRSVHIDHEAPGISPSDYISFHLQFSWRFTIHTQLAQCMDSNADLKELHT